MQDEPVAEPARYNLRILRPLSNYLRERHGLEQLERVAASAQLTVDELSVGMRWASEEQFETVLSAARALVRTDEEFQKACVYRLAESYGAVRFLLWATSPQTVYVQSIKTYHLMSTNCSPETLNSSRTSIEMRFPMGRPISRLNCLVRQAQTSMLPTLWGLPPAHLKEERCIALGDRECFYRLRWFDAKRWLPPVMGMGGGAALSAALGLATLAPAAPSLTTSALVALGGALGYIYELVRTNRENLRVGAEINAAVRDLAEEEADARRELLAMTQRHRDWNRLLEEERRERSQAFGDLLRRVDDVHHSRTRTLRGFSHDLRNPLTVLSAGIGALRDAEDSFGEDGPQLFDDLERAIDQMTRLLNDLMQVATSQNGFVQLAPPERVSVEELPDRLRRRVRALCLGKDIRVSAFKTREAPPSIEIDPLVLDRILDNVFTNAAKYTERGSIVVELDGNPGFLTVKVSDTGRGIARERLSRTFEPGGSDAQTRAANSYGVGLSVVVQLLGQIGGRLEVMSEPSQGTTFWIHFPLVMKTRGTASHPPPPESYRETLDRVLTIRKVSNG